MDSSLLNPAEERLHEVLRGAAQFTLELVKALGRTEYDAADHPAFREVAQRLYQQFREATRDAHELTYVLASTAEERGVMIEGLTPEPIEVARALTGTMGDHFVARLHDFFVRNHIASFTIKRLIEEAEFLAFFGLWVTWTTRIGSVEGRSACAIMREELNRAGILGVTVVGLDEVPGQSRHLAWQTRLVLARLRTELGRLVELRRLRPEALSRLKAQTISDAFRTHGRPSILAEVLLHADLISDAVPDFALPELERSLVEALAPSMLEPVAKRLLEWTEDEKRRSETAPPDRAVEAHPSALSRVTRFVMRRLAQNPTLGSGPLLERAHELGLIETDALPDDLRRRVKARELCQRFLDSPFVYLRDFEGCADPKSYLKYLNVFTVILPELVQRGEAEAVAAIFRTFHRHLKEEAPPFVGRARFLRETLDVLARGGVVAGLIALACKTPKERRAGLEEGVALFGEHAVPGLVTRLGVEDVSERAAAVSILLRIGPDAVPAILGELRAHRHPWFTVRNLISILGHARSRAALPVLKQYVRHPHPRVREELVQALASILGDEAEKALLPFLDDDNPTVVRKAISHLGAIRCTDLAFLRRLHDAVRLRNRSEDEPDPALQAACLNAIAQYEYQLLPQTPDLEAALLEVIHPPTLRTKLPSRFGVRPKSTELIVLAIRALGAIGGGRSLAVLGDLVGSREEEVKQAAIEATEQIRSRLTSQVTQSPLKF